MQFHEYLQRRKARKLREANERARLECTQELMTEPSALTLLFRSWHEKLCVPVKFESVKNDKQ